MRATQGSLVEVASLDDLDRRLSAGARSLTGWRLIGLDLTAYGEALRSRAVCQSLFLGCRFAEGDQEWLREAGAVVFPEIPRLPIDAYRTTLYAPGDLYDTDHYGTSLDARAYAWAQRPADQDDSLAKVLHDHAIDRALATWTAGRAVVGVMGGHALERGTPGFADAALLGQGLGARLTVATGGGPGAMEAANLGALLGAGSGEDLDAALTRLAAVPSFRPDIGAWSRAAFDVVETVPRPRESLGIPTWHYGHEPPNVFATAIAKYFGNATREAVLLQVCNAGIVFLPGAGGTVQEIFQDACENYYAAPGAVAPIILVGRRYWTEDLPAWPLLRALARGRAMEDHVHLVDTVEEACSVVTERVIPRGAERQGPR